MCPQTETTSHAESQDQATNNQNTSGVIATTTAIVGHRDSFGPSPDLTNGTCPIRIRLTSAQPRRLGSLWRLLRVPIYGGFETVFRFQVGAICVCGCRVLAGLRVRAVRVGEWAPFDALLSSRLRIKRGRAPR